MALVTLVTLMTSLMADFDDFNTIYVRCFEGTKAGICQDASFVERSEHTSPIKSNESFYVPSFKYGK